MRRLRFAACALALGALGAAGGAAATVTGEAHRNLAAATASPATWKPWLLTSADQFRLKSPPAAKSAQTKAELKQLLRRQKTRSTASSKALIKKWCSQPAAVPWVELELKLLQDYRPRVAPSPVPWHSSAWPCTTLRSRRMILASPTRRRAVPRPGFSINGSSRQ